MFSTLGKFSGNFCNKFVVKGVVICMNKNFSSLKFGGTCLNVLQLTVICHHQIMNPMSFSAFCED